METRYICLGIFDMSSTSYSADANVAIEFFSCTPQLDSSTLAMVCEIPSQRDCGNGGWYTLSVTYPHR
jgi:hypothetical protein